MLAVISPAKTLDFESPVRIRRRTEPEFIDQAAELAGVMRNKRPGDLKRLMGISDKLASLNVDRFQHWQGGDVPHGRQAALAFMGDVYTGLDAASLEPRDFDFAQKHLRILSGLYGLLRPLDVIEPYRLEMGTDLATPRGKGLYRYWGGQPAEALNAQARAVRTRYLVNLASNEYFGAVDPKILEPTVITPVFKDWNKGKYKILSFFAKQARGMMARHIIKTRARKPADLESFTAGGYRFAPDLSDEAQMVFTRKQA